MPKIKVTLEEKIALDCYLEIKETIEFNIKHYLNNCDAWEHEYISLKEMGFKKFVKCLIYGYESYPATPRLITDKVHISFNTVPEKIEKHGKDCEIYFVKNGSYKSFSLNEAREIRDTLDALIIYYNQYVNQNDEHDDRPEAPNGNF